ncbi:serine/threonine-protein kinase PCRK1-like isoform X2 [Magnolia sinica]|uniref:serine/threonine-protein kinase PCRK1-like isoform X2 n=1 Tax=Magnolia sinica TaxID=86752 RepID=UPI002658E14E|nr:serine/threonine-protein kinase PCRK1-like isoform X2 [Magnolia sinica]
MKCFHFPMREKREEQKTSKSTSARSFCTEVSDREARRSGSELNSLNVSDISAESMGRSPFPSLSQRPNNLKGFTFAELKIATRNFSRSLMVGEGGFGCVYRGTIKSPEDPQNKLEIAVKQLSRKGLQGHKEWVTEVNVLGVVDHPNLVKLVGYCAEDDERGIQRLLIYEFMPNRSVEDHLSTRSTTPLSWARRLRIALDAARGLTYLHEEMEFQVVGTIGYAAPEYVQTGRLTSKSDVWSYGIVLYELITGRRPVDRNRPKSEQKLLEWVKPYIQDIKKFHMILDSRLQGQYNLKSAQKLAAVANRCLVRHPKMRPKMSEVLELVKRIVDSSEMGSPQPPIRSLTPKDASKEPKRKRANPKKGILDWRIGESGWWRSWKPKLKRMW